MTASFSCGLGVWKHRNLIALYCFLFTVWCATLTTEHVYSRYIFSWARTRFLEEEARACDCVVWVVFIFVCAAFVLQLTLGSWQSGDFNFSNAWHDFHLCDSAQAAESALLDILIRNKQPEAHWITSSVKVLCFFFFSFHPPFCLIILTFFVFVLPCSFTLLSREGFELNGYITYCTIRYMTIKQWFYNRVYRVTEN